MRKYWRRLLFWLFADLLSEVSRSIRHEGNERELSLMGALNRQQREFETRITNVENVALRGNKLILEEREILDGKLNAFHLVTIERLDEINNRLAQVLALGFGKTPQEWQKPLAREPKKFDYDNRQ